MGMACARPGCTAIGVRPHLTRGSQSRPLPADELALVSAQGQRLLVRVPSLRAQDLRVNF